MPLGLSVEQWVSGATVVGVIIALITLAWQIKGQRNQLEENKKTRSAQIANDFMLKLNSQPYANILRTISLSELRQATISIDTGLPTDIQKQFLNEFDLVMYLTELETLSLFINDNVIEEKYSYEVFSDIIFMVFTNQSVSKYIDGTKKNRLDSYDQLKKTNIKLLEYRKKKINNPKEGKFDKIKNRVLSKICKKS